MKYHFRAANSILHLSKVSTEHETGQSNMLFSGGFNSNDVLGKVKMFDQIASMTEEAKQEAIKKRMDYERRRSVFEKRKTSSSSSGSRGQN